MVVWNVIYNASQAMQYVTWLPWQITTGIIVTQFPVLTLIKVPTYIVWTTTKAVSSYVGNGVISLWNRHSEGNYTPIFIEEDAEYDACVVTLA